jgi:hypothetical protein
MYVASKVLQQWMFLLVVASYYKRCAGGWLEVPNYVAK